jgi:hypothetical protein
MGKPWVAYSWLFEVIVYGLYQAFGLVGIVLYTTAFSLLIAAALHRLVRRFALPFALEILVTAIGLGALMPLFSPRSWLFTILFFAVEVDLIVMARRSGNTSGLWFLPPLFVVWANTHIQFCYGLLLLGFVSVEALLDKFVPESVQGSTARPIPFLSSLQVLVACIAATLVTPYHFHLYSILIGLIQQTGQFRDIQEMQPLPFRDVASWCVLFAALGAAFSMGRRKDAWVFPLLSLIAGSFLSFRAIRDVWFLAVTALPIIASCWPTGEPAQRFALTKPRVALVAAAGLIAICVIAWKQDISPSHLETVVAEHFPVAAVAVVEQRGYQGPLYNDYGWGGYLIWRLRTIPVIIDNRGNVHGDERIRRSAETWAGLNNWDSDPDLLSARLIMGGAQTTLASLLRLDSRFALVYEDKVAAVFLVHKASLVGRATTSQ